MGESLVLAKGDFMNKSERITDELTNGTKLR